MKSLIFILKVPALASKCRLWHEDKANQSIPGEKLPHFDINNIFVAQKLRKLRFIWLNLWKKQEKIYQNYSVISQID